MFNNYGICLDKQILTKTISPMFQNYLKLTFRNLLKEKVYTSINLLGLTLGIASFIVIFLIIRYDLNYDGFHSKSDQIFRVVRHSTNSSGVGTEPNVPYPFAKALREEMPELASGITLFDFHQEDQIEYNDVKGFEEKIIFAEPQFFKMFDFIVISGNPEKDMAEIGKVFLTERVALKYFGNADPIGKTIRLGGSTDLEVVGILGEAPGNSHIQFSMVVSYPTFSSEFTGGFDIENWGANMSGYSYMLLPDHLNKENVERQINEVTSKFYPEDYAEQTEYFLQPMNDVHFNEQYSNGTFAAVDRGFIMILSGIGFFILLIACINFINMSTALASKRSKEVGVRKTLGASSSELVRKFLGETFMISLFSMLLAIGLVERMMPSINVFLNKRINFYLLTDHSLLMTLVGLLIFVTLASGLYPSVVMSRFQPILALKSGTESVKGSSYSLRMMLVIFQFIISQVLIISTIIISSQMDYFMNKPLGFDSEAIVTIQLVERDSAKLQTLKQQLLLNSNIKNISYAVGVPTSDNSIGTGFTINERGDDERHNIRLKVADEDYMETFGLEMIAGRWIDQRDNTGNKGLVINEAAQKEMGFSLDEVIGKHITLGINQIDAPIIGVVKDFHMKSLHQPIAPMVILDMPVLYYEAGVKIGTANIPETIQLLKENWERTFPEHVFQYSFLDDNLQDLYQSEQRTFMLFNIFSGISILIACIGLFGLISFVISQKTKEIGIRKVLGASVSSLLILITSNFLKLMIIGFILATVAVWYGIDVWLSNFAYRIDIHLGYFIVGLVITFIITMLTIGFQSYRAAMSNPVDALKDE